MHRVWIGVDSGVPVRKQTRHHVARVALEGTLLWIRAKLSVHALVSGLESIRAFRSENKHGSNFVQSYFVRILAYGTWLRCNINAPCLDWSRFGRSRQKAHTASCVNTAMIEGMRYEVCLLLQWLVGAPCYGYGQSSPCMHRVWIGVDSGVSVRKLTRYHMVICAKSSLTCRRAKFSSRVHLDLEASRMFRPTPRKKIWSHFVLSHFVRTLAYGTNFVQSLSLIHI